MLLDVNETTGEISKVNQSQINELEKQEKQRELLKEREKKCEYNNWMQVNLDNTRAMRELAKKSPTGMQIFLFITEQMDGYNALVCSRTVMAEALELSLASVARGIAYLAEHNFIKIGKVGSTNVYHANSELVWKSWSTNKRYAEFNARVIIAETEQQPQPKSKIKSKNMKMVEIKNKK